MQTLKIYRHMYDNDKDSYGTEKPNEYLGEFEFSDDEQLGYDFEFIGTRKEDGKKYKVSGRKFRH